MRNGLLKITLILVLSTGIISCTVLSVANSKNPKKVAERFLKHFYKCEYKEAKQYGTIKTRQIIDLMDQLIAVSGQKVLPTDQKVLMLDCIQKGDTAYCDYLINDVKSDVVLIKIEKRWLVDLKKEGKGPLDKNKFLEDFLKNTQPDDKKK